jgi:hypothetical protein
MGRRDQRASDRDRDRCPVDLSLIRGSDVQTELLSASRLRIREAGLTVAHTEGERTEPIAYRQ